MKHVLNILIVSLLFNFLNIPNTLAQNDEYKKTKDYFEMDLVKVPVAPEALKLLPLGIEKEIYDQLDKAAYAARYSSYATYRGFLLPNAEASSEGIYFYTNYKEVDSIILPALSSFEHYTNYANSNVVNVIDAQSADQYVEVKLLTDTTGHTPSYNHMRMVINWTKPSDTWKISNMDRYLSF